MEKQLFADASGIVALDSFQIQLETIRIDKPSTKNKPHLIVGNYDDPLFGNIQAEAYTQLSYYNFDTLKLGNDAVIDSINLSIYPDFALGTNTTSPLTFKVYHLAEPFDSTKKLDHTSKMAYDYPLTSDYNFTFAQTTQRKTIYPAPDPSRSIDSIGFYQLSRLLKACNNKTEREFRSIFNGLALIPSSKSTYAIGINTGYTSSLGMTVYYHLSSNPTNVSSYIFGIYDDVSKRAQLRKAQRFTKIDRTALDDNETSKIVSKLFSDTGNIALPASQLGDMAFMNDALGIRTRISFPGLSSFLASIKGKYIITEASILIPIADQSYTQSTTSPTPALNLIETDENGKALKNASDTISEYKIIQSEVINYGKGDLNGVGYEYYSGFQNYYKRFYYPFTLYTQEMSNGSKPNNPFIPSLSSYFGSITQSPLGYSFYDRSRSNGIRLLIVLNKIK